MMLPPDGDAPGADAILKSCEQAYEVCGGDQEGMVAVTAAYVFGLISLNLRQSTVGLDGLFDGGSGFP